MEFRILGPFEVASAGTARNLGGPRQRAVLISLLLRANELVPTEQLLDDVWSGAPPPDGTNTLHGYVFHLRKALEPDRAPGEPPRILVSGRGGYRLVVAPDDVDAVAFERLADQGRRLLAAGDPRGARVVLEDALALWRGPPLAEFDDLDRVRIEAARLTERQARAVEDLVDALVADDAPAQALDAVDRALGEHPWREHLWAQRILCLYRLGRQADALAAAGEIRTRLRDELGLDPGPELQDLERRILDHDPSLMPTPRDEHPTPLPGLPAPVTTFVGRSADVERLLTTLDHARLVTLIGPGGVGKTRLAVEAMRQWPDDGGHVWFVDLADVDRGDLVEPALAHALAGRSSASIPVIAERFERDHGVVIVDNCEHVIAAAAATIASLLAACARMKVVATSREALAVDGEHLVAVAPLATPDLTDAATVSDALATPAVALFVDRARAVDRDFDASAHPDAVLTICAALDGIPLGLELAAARLRSLPLDQLAARIDDRFRILTGGSRGRVSRQQTLEAAVAWSYDLLTDLERITFDRLSVFSGGFTLDAAEAVLTHDPIQRHDVVDLVGQLVDKSLLMLEAATGRYRMLETLRAYAAERLADDPDHAADIRARHARWFATFITQRARSLTNDDDPDIAAAVDVEAPNLRAALEWARTSGRSGLVAELAVGLSPWWEQRGLLGEARPALEAVVGSDIADPTMQWQAWLSLGVIAGRQGDRDTAIAYTEGALSGLRELDDPFHLAHALGRAGWVALGAGDTARAVALANEGLALAEEVGDARIAPWMHLGLGHAAHEEGDLEAATEHLRAAQAGFEASGSRAGLGRALFHLALLGIERRDFDGAREVAGRALEVTDAAKDLSGIVMAVEVIALVASAAGDHLTAVTLDAAASATRRRVGAHSRDALAGTDTIEVVAAGRLPEGEVEEAAERGARFELDDMVGTALAYTIHRGSEIMRSELAAGLVAGDTDGQA